MTGDRFGNRSIVIVGGGFAGAVTAIKLLDGARSPLSVSIIESRSELGRGLAYGTAEPDHLVNGPARIFGLYPDDPDHLVRWLAANGASHGWLPPANLPESTPPRQLYGSYVQGALSRAVEAARETVSFRHVQERALRIETTGGRFRVVTDAGSNLAADEVVLALGVFGAEETTSGAEALKGNPRVVIDPWDFSALDRLPRSGELLLIGSGLTMVDVVVSMERRGFRGRYRIVSRRGNIVEGRRVREPWPDFLGKGPLPATARALLAAVKAERRRIANLGEDWQRLPLSIRPYVLPLWYGASDAERRRFARHLRPFWDVTLHRAAGPSADIVEAVRAEGRFSGAAGRVLGLSDHHGRIQAEVRWRRDGQRETLLVDGVVNCRGQTHDWTKIADPFVRNLVADGIVRPHPTGFGIEATPDGEVFGADGVAHRGVSAIGHPLRGVAWESSSIGEELEQAIALADRLLRRAEIRTAA